jgi:hypothetical protein
MSAPERQNTVRGRWWEHCTVQYGVRPCHSKCRTALCHQIYIERETGWNSPRVKCTIWGSVSASVYDWCKSFPKVVNRSLTATCSCAEDNCHRFEHSPRRGAGFGNRITVRHFASKVYISVGNVETIVNEHLLFKKVCARCVPKMPTSTRRHNVFLCLPNIWTGFNWRETHF